MDNHQQFSLKWNNYLQHISGAFDSLRTSEDFVDVTLSCEGKKIKAHKMLLSACSNYFREIFKDNQCTHPVIVFHNIKFEDLSGLVTFMYQGQVNVEQECLQSFLNTAELLEVQGLTSPSTKALKAEDEDESVSDVSSGGGGNKVSSPSSKRKRTKPVEEPAKSPPETVEEPPQNDETPQDDEGEDSLPQTPQFLLHQDNSLTQDNSDPYTDPQFFQPGKEEPPDINASIDPSGSSNDYQDSLQVSEPKNLDDSSVDLILTVFNFLTLRSSKTRISLCQNLIYFYLENVYFILHLVNRSHCFLIQDKLVKSVVDLSNDFNYYYN